MTEPGSYPRRRDVRDSRTTTAARPPAPRRSRDVDIDLTAAERPRPPRDKRAGRAEHPLPTPTGSADTVSVVHAGDDPRGRHASGTGDGFHRLVLLTVLGAAVPGSGLVAAGRRVAGWLVLLPVLALVGAGLAVVLSGRVVSLARSVVFDPTAMLWVAGAAAVGALAWCAVILASHGALRTSTMGGALTRGQKLASLVLVTALMAVVVAPATTVTRYAMINHSLLQNLFHGGSSGEGLANTAAADPWAGVSRVNVLLLGADTGSDRVGTRPDTVMVASIDPSSGNTALLSLPRQLEDVPFPKGSEAEEMWPTACEADGAGGCMLNAVYLFGTLHPELFGGTKNGNDPGVEATKQAVGEATGLDINYYAMVDMEGFQQIVDAMGGLTLNVPRDIPIGGGVILGTNPERHYKITGWIKEGPAQKLDGFNALWFARSREGSNNNDRMARQQCVISAAVQQYGPKELALKFPSLADAAQENIRTDIPADELNAFVDLGQRVKGGDLHALSFTIDNIDTGDPDYAEMQQMVQNALHPAPTPAAPAPSASGTAAPAPAPSASAPVDPKAAVDPTTVC